MKTRTFAGGALVFAEGDAGGEAFVVISGMVEISTRRSGKKVVLARLGEGQIFGEMAIISKAPRSASAFCLADCELMVVDQQTLDDKVRSADPFLRFLVRSLIDMVHQTAKKL